MYVFAVDVVPEPPPPPPPPLVLPLPETTLAGIVIVNDSDMLVEPELELLPELL